MADASPQHARPRWQRPSHSLTPAEMERYAARADFERDKAEGRRVRSDMRHGKEGGVSGYIDKKLAAMFARQSKARMRRR